MPHGRMKYGKPEIADYDSMTEHRRARRMAKKSKTGKKGRKYAKKGKYYDDIGERVGT